MQKKKNLISAIAIMFAAILAFTVNIPVSAAVYSDVPAWAKDAVDRMTSLGYMTGDLSGKFNPSDYVDKFEASKILARMAGYKASGATAAEQAYYDSCLKKFSGYISLFSNKFKKWNSATNKEVAFLLDKGILMQEDLNQFVLIVDNQERVKALTKEEAALFFVRLMGKASAAATATAGKAFADDSSISTSFKTSVYYLRNIGAVSGDEANKFNPKSSVTKVVMAVMSNSIYSQMNPSANPPTQAPATQAPSATTPPGSNYETITGTIAKLYSSFNAVQITSANANYNNKIYIVSSKATVTINGAAKAYGDLKENMMFNGVLSNGELISLTVSSDGTVTPPDTSTATQPPAVTAGSSIIEGTVASTKTENGVSYIAIEVRMLNTRGDIYTETRNFALANGCTITRGSAAVLFNTIVKGDIVKATVNGSYVNGLQLEQKNRVMTGEITDKQFNSASSYPLITVTDANGVASTFKVASTTSIYRKGYGTVTWSELRIGDSVDLAAEYDVLTTINAYGETGYKDGYVNEIVISAEYAKVTVTDDKNVVASYRIISGLADPYILRVGSKVRLSLDSKEVRSITLLEDAKTASLIGNITFINAGKIIVKDTSSYTQSREITINSGTIIIDAATGNKVSSSSLYLDMKVFVVFSDAAGTVAKTITILGR